MDDSRYHTRSKSKRDEKEFQFIGQDGVDTVEDDEISDLGYMLERIKYHLEKNDKTSALKICKEAIKLYNSTKDTKQEEMISPSKARTIVQDEMDKQIALGTCNNKTQYLQSKFRSPSTASSFLKGNRPTYGPAVRLAAEILRKQSQINSFVQQSDPPDGIADPHGLLDTWYKPEDKKHTNYLLLNPDPDLKVTDKNIQSIKTEWPWKEVANYLYDDEFREFVVFLKRIFYVGKQPSDGWTRVYKHLCEALKDHPSQKCEERISLIWVGGSSGRGEGSDEKEKGSGPIVMISSNWSEACASTVEALLIDVLTQGKYPPHKLPKKRMEIEDKYSFTNQIAGTSTLPNDTPKDQTVRVAAGLLLKAFDKFSNIPDNQILPNHTKNFRWKDKVIKDAF